MLIGDMLCGVEVGRLRSRVGKAQEAEALAMPGAEVIGFNGCRMGGLLWVDADACLDVGLTQFIEIASRYAGALPPSEYAPVSRTVTSSRLAQRTKSLILVKSAPSCTRLGSESRLTLSCARAGARARWRRATRVVRAGLRNGRFAARDPPIAEEGA
jgi:hypothetical protein